MGLFDPPAANIPLPQMQSYNPIGQGPADFGALAGVAGLGNYNTYANYLPQAQNVGNGLLNNPYASMYQGGAGTAAGLGMGGALNAYGQGQSLYNLAPSMFGMGNSIANTAFDPQNLLYNRTVQQLQDQTRASEGARGIATTPYGAGLENTAMSNFNIDWQNNQLGRQLSGAQGAGNAYGQGAGLIGQGAGLQANAPGQYLTSAGLPYNTFQGMGTSNLGTIGTLGQLGSNASAIPQQQITDLMNYLGWGTQQQNANNQGQQNLFADALSRDKQAFGEQSSMFGGLGSLAGSLFGTAFSGGIYG